MALIDLLSNTIDFFQQARESIKSNFQEKGIVDITKRFSIVTVKRDEDYTTTIFDLSNLIDAHEGKQSDSVFAWTSTTSFDEAIINHYSCLEYLKKLGY